MISELNTMRMKNLIGTKFSVLTAPLGHYGFPEAKIARYRYIWSFLPNMSVKWHLLLRYVHGEFEQHTIILINPSLPCKKTD